VKCDVRFAREIGLQIAQRERPPGNLHDAAARVVAVEFLIAPPCAKVRVSQEEAGVFAHQQGEIGLFGYELVVDHSFFDEHLADPEAERRIAPRLHRHPEVRVDGGGVEVGRDADDLRAVVTGLGQEVYVGDLGVVRVRSPTHDHVGEEVVVRRAFE
jgi:hypothetical protein